MSQKKNREQKPAPTKIKAQPKPVSKIDWLLVPLIGVIIFVSFFPTLQGLFLEWDDSGMFVENIDYRGLGWPNLKWMFTTTHYAHYHPITWLTLGFDYKIWGMNPKGYHLTSLLFHCANGIVFYFLVKAFLRRERFFAPHQHSLGFALSCAAGALFFAIHPLRVESVCWATERRDVVSGLFYLLTLIAYLRASDNGKNKRWLTLSLLFFVLSFLSKAWGITLPIVLLVLDIYPLRRIQPGEQWIPAVRKLIIEKIPFFLVAAALAVVAYLGQAQWGIEAQHFGIMERFATAFYGLCFYMWKTVVPLDLSPIYLLPLSMNPFEVKYILCALTIVALVTLLFVFRRRWPWAIAAWFCYAVIVSPVIGLTQRGDQIAADRYTYLSCLPFALLVALGLARLVVLYREKKISNAILFPMATVALGGMIALSILSYRQSKVWHDEYSLWDHAANIDPTNWMAISGRGRERMERRGDLQGAIKDLDRALQLNPKKVEAYSNRGMAYHRLNDLDKAMVDYTSALNLNPMYQTYNNRAAIYEVRGDTKQALDDYTRSLDLNPRFSTALYNRARLRKQKGDMAGALQDLNNCLKYNPTYADAYERRGNLLREKGDLNGAFQDYSNALHVAPADWPQRNQVEQKLSEVRTALQQKRS